MVLNIDAMLLNRLTARHVRSHGEVRCDPRRPCLDYLLPYMDMSPSNTTYYSLPIPRYIAMNVVLALMMIRFADAQEPEREIVFWPRCKECGMRLEICECETDELVGPAPE